MTETDLAWYGSIGRKSFDCDGRIERFRNFDLGHCDLQFICNLVLEIWNFISFFQEWEKRHNRFKAANIHELPIMVGPVRP
jgi:hypothetical protein